MMLPLIHTEHLIKSCFTKSYQMCNQYSYMKIKQRVFNKKVVFTALSFCFWSILTEIKMSVQVGLKKETVVKVETKNY